MWHGEFHWENRDMMLLRQIWGMVKCHVIWLRHSRIGCKSQELGVKFLKIENVSSVNKSCFQTMRSTRKENIKVKKQWRSFYCKGFKVSSSTWNLAIEKTKYCLMSLLLNLHVLSKRENIQNFWTAVTKKSMENPSPPNRMSKEIHIKALQMWHIHHWTPRDFKEMNLHQAIKLLLFHLRFHWCGN